MYKNSGYLRNAVGVKDHKTKEEEKKTLNLKRVKRGCELHDLTQEIIAKARFFDLIIEDEIGFYLEEAYDNITEVSIHSDSLWVETNYKGLKTSELLEIEMATGYEFERKIDLGWRYIFTIEEKFIDKYTGLGKFAKDVPKIKKYIESGKSE